MNIINKNTPDNGDHDRGLIVSSFGFEQTKSGKTVGPWVREKYIIHYVFDGKGTFNGIPIERGNAFLICPNELHHYSSDSDSPLEYGWLSFLGHDADRLLEEIGLELKNHVFDCPWIGELDTLFRVLCSDLHKSVNTEEFLEGCFHILMSFHRKVYQSLTPDGRKKSLIKQHVENATKYINDNYYHKLSVNDVASSCFISAHYLSNIFRKHMGISPQQYILNVRMKRAVELLALDGLSITAIASSVGYSDVLAFSKAFRKVYGVSPRKHREGLS